MSPPAPRILFLYRRPSGFVSIERVFGQISASLRRLGLIATEQTLPFGSGALGILLNLLLFRPQPADIYHITGHVHFIALRLPKGRTVLTIHDLRFLERRAGVRGWLIRKLFLDWPLKRVAAVTVISVATRDHLVRETGIAREKIFVIGNPLGDEFVGAAVEPGSESSRRVLQMGTMDNKNLETVIEALRGSDCVLHVVGRLSGDQETRLRKAGITFENSPELDPLAIVDAYRRAAVLTFCSTAEGFGLPIIEANAVGLPVVTSNRAPMSDVAGGAALLVEPHDPVAIRSAIESIMSEPELRESLVRLGKANILRFDAASVAEAYQLVYRTVMGGRD